MTVLLRPVNQFPVVAQCQRMQAIATWVGTHQAMRPLTPAVAWVAEAALALSYQCFNTSDSLHQFHTTFFGDLQPVPAEHDLPHAGQGWEMQMPNFGGDPATSHPIVFSQQRPLFGPFALDAIQGAFQACTIAPDDTQSVRRYVARIEAWMDYPGECIQQALREARLAWQTQRVGAIDIILRATDLDDEDLDEAGTGISRAEAMALFSDALDLPHAPPHLAHAHDQFTAEVLAAAADVDQFPVHCFGVDFAVVRWLLGPYAVGSGWYRDTFDHSTTIFGALRAADGRDISITADVVTALIRHFGRIPTTGEDHALAVEFVVAR